MPIFQRKQRTWPPTRQLISKLKDINRSAANADKAVGVEAVAAQRLLLTNRILSDSWTMRNVDIAYHLLPAMARTLMGLQVRPMGIFALTGIPRLWAIWAHWGESELWTLLQQYCFSVVHWPALFKRYTFALKKPWLKNKITKHTPRGQRGHQQRRQQEQRKSWRTFRGLLTTGGFGS